MKKLIIFFLLLPLGLISKEINLKYCLEKSNENFQSFLNAEYLFTFSQFPSLEIPGRKHPVQHQPGAKIAAPQRMADHRNDTPAGGAIDSLAKHTGLLDIECCVVGNKVPAAKKTVLVVLLVAEKLVDIGRHQD